MTGIGLLITEIGGRQHIDFYSKRDATSARGEVALGA
jgi:hypothetical protein